MPGKRIIIAFVTCFFILAGSAFAQKESEGQENGGKALFEGKCSACHALSRPLDKTKTRDGWTATVTRMQKVNGCRITDAEAVEIVNYLVKVRGPK